MATPEKSGQQGGRRAKRRRGRRALEPVLRGWPLTRHVQHPGPSHVGDGHLQGGPDGGRGMCWVQAGTGGARAGEPTRRCTRDMGIGDWWMRARCRRPEWQQRPHSLRCSCHQGALRTGELFLGLCPVKSLNHRPGRSGRRGAVQHAARVHRQMQRAEECSREVCAGGCSSSAVRERAGGVEQQSAIPRWHAGRRLLPHAACTLLPAGAELEQGAGRASQRSSKQAKHKTQREKRK